MSEPQPVPRGGDARLVRSLGSEGLEFAAARSADEVRACWGLAYRAYRRVGLIDSNPHRLYAPIQAAHARTAVFLGRIGPVIVSTVTAVPDDGSPLPMQTPFEPEILRLRGEGCRLLEAVLFADRREQLERCSQSLLELVRLVYFFARWCGATDVVASVQPSDVSFFQGVFAFRELGPACPCPQQMHRPAVPMRCNLRDLADHLAHHPALGHVLGAEVPDSVFEHRFSFDPTTLAAHALGDYLYPPQASAVCAAG